MLPYCIVNYSLFCASVHIKERMIMFHSSLETVNIYKVFQCQGGGVSFMHAFMMWREKLSESISKANFEKVKENFSVLSNTQGTFCVNGMWKATKKVFPKHAKPLPVAKVDNTGRLVSKPEELKNLYLDTYVHRLRPPTNPS